MTEIYDYLRLLFARVGHAHCPECGKPITQQTIQQMTDDVMSFPEGTKILILAPMIQGKKGNINLSLNNCEKRVLSVLALMVWYAQWMRILY